MSTALAITIFVFATAMLGMVLGAAIAFGGRFVRKLPQQLSAPPSAEQDGRHAQKAWPSATPAVMTDEKTDVRPVRARANMR